MIKKDNVMCSTMVIVKEDFTPVCNWLLGSVVEVYHGSDGKGCGSPVVKVSDRGRHVVSLSPVPPKDSPCRAALHVKSVES
ncbi:hypothetical protein TNCV_1324591 [Trichonephila clavipes]|nr:hypothetical protein TNCV_1324591 [Trichonephila clavipes]